MTASSQERTRAVSETAGVVVLVAITVTATLGVGLSVFLLTGGEENEFGVRFSFQHLDGLEELLIFYDDGDELRAGDVYIDGPANNVSWAELRGLDPDDTFAPGDQPARLGSSTVYDNSVGAEAYVEVIYNPEGEDKSVVATFGESEAGSGDGTVPGNATGN